MTWLTVQKDENDAVSLQKKGPHQLNSPREKPVIYETLASITQQTLETNACSSTKLQTKTNLQDAQPKVLLRSKTPS